MESKFNVIEQKANPNFNKIIFLKKQHNSYVLEVVEIFYNFNQTIKMEEAIKRKKGKK